MADNAFHSVYETFAKSEGSKDGKLSPDGVKKWFKESAVIGKDTGITEADVDTAIGKVCKDKKPLEFSQVKETVNTLAKEKKMEPKELMNKLAAAGPMQSTKPGAPDMGAKLPKDEKQNVV